MKDFQRIDWKIYNRPPFYQQWLCKEDTLKLTTFGDKGLSEIDCQVLALKDQWDIENVRGHSLDRIGKILKENRKGNVDKIYRMFLKLRTMLNTADGTINDIIKIIKFIYSSREVKITPDYPAGLVIEYDGEEQDYFDYNAILAQVIAAGVGFHTRAMFDFMEDPININEKALIKVVADFTDDMKAQDGPFSLLTGFSFADRVLTRSAVVYGGVKAFDRYNGVHAHEGTIAFQGHDGNLYNGIYLHNGGIPFGGNVSKYKHDGTILFGSGLSDTFASDDFSTAIIIDFIDTVSLQENLIINATKNMQDRFPTSQIYDGGMNHDGKHRWDAAHEVLEVYRPETLLDSAAIEDGPAEITAAADFTDTEAITEAAGPHTATLDLEENAGMDEETVLSARADFSDSAAMSDDFAASMTGYWVYGGADNPLHSHDGSIGFNYGISVPA